MEVWTEELVAKLVEKALISEKAKDKDVILHSGNGKSFTLKAKLEELGIMSSYSRPRVSNDNPF